MHYIVDFEGKDEWDAFEAMVEWYGEEGANKIFGHVREAIAEGAPPELCRIAFALSGVEGYPVEVFLERYHPECHRH